MPKGKKRDPDGFPCLVVTFEEAPTLNDTQKYVRFIGGVGVLDKIALLSERPDWGREFSDEKLAGLVLEYKRYWRDKGAKVEVVDEGKAAKIKADLLKPKKAKPELPADPEKTLDDIKKSAEAEIDARTDGAPEGEGNDPLPHQQ